LVNLKQRQLMLQADLALTKRIHTPSDGGNALTDIEIEALHHGGIDLPATCRQDLHNGRHGAKHHSVLHPHHALAPVLLVGLEQGAIPEGPFPHSPRLEPYMIVSKSYGSTPVVQLSFLTVICGAKHLEILQIVRITGTFESPYWLDMVKLEFPFWEYLATFSTLLTIPL
jgi:hypothetical protein